LRVDLKGNPRENTKSKDRRLPKSKNILPKQQLSSGGTLGHSVQIKPLMSGDTGITPSPSPQQGIQQLMSQPLK
jgi:hypothetical protein